MLDLLQDTARSLSRVDCLLYLAPDAPLCYPSDYAGTLPSKMVYRFFPYMRLWLDLLPLPDYLSSPQRHSDNPVLSSLPIYLMWILQYIDHRDRADSSVDLYPCSRREPVCLAICGGTCFGQRLWASFALPDPGILPGSP